MNNERRRERIRELTELIECAKEEVSDVEGELANARKALYRLEVEQQGLIKAIAGMDIR